jgi:aminopeptidase N
LLWLSHLAGVVTEPDDQARLVRLLRGEEEIPGVAMGPLLRWATVIRLCSLGHADGAVLASAELERNPKAKGRAFAAEVASPDPEVKARTWERFLAPPVDGEERRLLSAGLSHFHYEHQQDLLEPFAERFFAEAVGVFERCPRTYAHGWFMALFPPYPTQGVIEQADAFIAACPDAYAKRLAVEDVAFNRTAAACRRAT